MSTPATDVPDHFYIVHLDLAREPGHPEGSVEDRYTLLLPLTVDGRIIEADARTFADFCRVSHKSGQDELRRGLIRRDEDVDGAWVFDFGAAGGEPEIGVRFSQERFAPGEYVTVQRDDAQHTYRVISLQPL